VSQPAARLGDPMLLTGAIVQGFPTVLIGGMPAARAYDMTACPGLHVPMVPIPHPGFIIGPGAAVLIGGSPAALQMDFAMCAIPMVDLIMQGCPTVLMSPVPFSAMMSRLLKDFDKHIPPVPDWEGLWTLYLPMIVNPFLPLIIAIARGKFDDALWVKAVIAYNTNLVLHLDLLAVNVIAGVNVAAAVTVAAAVAFVVWPLVSTPTPSDGRRSYVGCESSAGESTDLPFDGAHDYAPVYFL
jgi:uncharacterized Zn-binding protein involved in type VI secretion